ncbi:MAG: glycosyl hydrolase 53 family protein [Candidatus Marinimicrobia bacterium]|nr:glycosyl hydrolase 53 family protein [Candidatus Neomarinimicrobiota bacterium]
MKRRTVWILIFVSFFANRILLATDTQLQEMFIKGVDLSSLPEVEECGGIFKEKGIISDPILIFKNHGVNLVRLRIWHTPSAGYCNLEKTLVMARRIKSMGLKFLLDLHYSDTWADPGQQSKPESWDGLSFEQLADSVFQYTFNVMASLKKQNTLPDMVQFGNEIICGLLWDDGCICDSFNTPEQWAQLAELLGQGILGLRTALGPGDSVKTMIHIDRGADNSSSQWFFDHLPGTDMEFDIIGLSYYPWWHGTLNDLENNVNDLAQRYNKNIFLVETAYPWTLNWNDDTHNMLGNSNQLHRGYPASVEGQRCFLADLMEIIKNIPNYKGLGVCYWEPGWISAPEAGSSWENVTLFNFSGELLSSVSVFEEKETGLTNHQSLTQYLLLQQNYPNPFNAATTIQYILPKATNLKLSVCRITGNLVQTLVTGDQCQGEHKIEWKPATNLPSGIYLICIHTDEFFDTKKCLLLR